VIQTLQRSSGIRRYRNVAFTMLLSQCCFHNVAFTMLLSQCCFHNGAPPSHYLLVSLQEDVRGWGRRRHGKVMEVKEEECLGEQAGGEEEVMGSSALGVATCLRVHGSGRWEVRLGVATWVCSAPQGAVLVSGNATTQFEAAVAVADIAVKPSWWNNPFPLGHGVGGGGDACGSDGSDPNAPALDLVYGTSPPDGHGKLDASLRATVAPCHLTLERTTVARLFGFFTDNGSIDHIPGSRVEGEIGDGGNNDEGECDSLAGSAPGCASARYSSGPDSVGGFSRVGVGGGGGDSVTGAALREVTTTRLKRTRTHTQQMLSLRRIAVHLEIAAPKIQLPVRRADGTVRFQGLVDLGHLTFRSAAAVHVDRLRHERSEIMENASSVSASDGAAPDQAPEDPFEHFHVQWRDMSVHLAAAEFDWRTAGPGATVLEGCDVVLERCGAVATVAVLNGNGGEERGDVGPPLRVKVRLPAIAVHLSPGRIARILAIVSATTGGKETGGAGGGSVDELNTTAGGREDSGGRGGAGGMRRQPWESPALEGPVTVLQTGARGRRGGWQRRWLAINGVHLYILEVGPLTCLPLVRKRLVRASILHVRV